MVVPIAAPLAAGAMTGLDPLSMMFMGGAMKPDMTSMSLPTSVRLAVDAGNHSGAVLNINKTDWLEFLKYAGVGVAAVLIYKKVLK